jgi:acetyl-CoA synthetase (ADP-forming)
MDSQSQASTRNRRTLSELESRKVLATYGIPLVPSRSAATASEAVRAAEEFGFPVVLKGAGEKLAHKTEAGVVRLDLRSASEVEAAYVEIARRAGDRLETVLVQPLVRSEREFVAGLTRDPQFGPCVMFGLGGIFTEALKDVAFRVAPIEERDALEMLDDIRAHKLLDAIRGKPAADRATLAGILRALGRLGLERPEVAEVDLNPILLDGPKPVAVDALIVLDEPETPAPAH